MAMLETYKVKPSGMFSMTIKALDDDHLGLILTNMFTKGSWKNLDETLQVEIKQPVGNIITPRVKDFRSSDEI